MDYFKKGIGLYEEKKYNEAIKILENIKSNDDKYLASQYIIGVCYMKKSEIEKENCETFLERALSYFFKVLKIKKYHYETLYNVSLVYLLLNNLQKAYIYSNIANSVKDCEQSEFLVNRITELVRDVMLE